MRVYPILGRKLKISEGRVNYNRYYNEFKKKIADARNAFLEEYEKKCHSIEDVSNYALKIGNNIISHYLEECMDYITELGVYNISVERFAEQYYWKYYTFQDRFQEINDKYMDIILTEEQKDEYRRMRRQNRSRWEGGGFGFSGAIKGAATAGAMNMASGAVHGMVNLSGKMISSIAAASKKSKLFKDENTLDTLVRGIRESMYGIFFALTACIKDRKLQEISEVFSKDKEEAETIIKNLKKDIIPEEKRLEVAVHVLELDPYNKDIYIYFIRNYGDSEREIENIADFFEINVYSEKIKIIDEIYKEIDFSSEETTKKGKEKLIKTATYLGLEESDIEGLEEVEKKLEEYDLQARTVNNIIFDTREEAALARKEVAIIEEILRKINKDNESEVIKAKEEILELNFKTGVQKDYLDQLDNLLEELDLKAKTYNEVVYDTREEAALHKKEDEMILKIYDEMDDLELKSIDECYDKILQLPLVTNIRDEYIMNKNLYPPFEMGAEAKP